MIIAMRRRVWVLCAALAAGVGMSALATDMEMKAKVLSTVETTGAGRAEILCDDPAGWTFDASASTDAGRDVVTVKLSSPVPKRPPQFGVYFRVRGDGIQNVWTCNQTQDGFHLRPKLWWEGQTQQQSTLAGYMPLAVGFNSAGVSKAAIAASESFERVLFGLYADDETCDIIGRCEFFTHPVADCTAYEVKVLFDRRGLDWAQTVREASEWISSVNGFTAADVPEAAYDPLYSTWYAYLQDVHAHELEKEAVLAASVGMKTMILDDGWQKEDSVSFYSKTGDWMPVASRFPDMKAHVAAVHRAGLKYMLWMGLSGIGVEAKAFPRFKDKLLRVGGGCGTFDPRFPEVREYLISVCERAVGEWGFDGMKLDFIDSFVLPEVDPAVAQGYAGRDYRSLPQAVDRLMKDILARLKRINPEALVEFRQPYMGSAIRQYGNMMRCADCPADPCANRKRIADLRLTSGKTAVHSDMLVWSKDETPEGAALPILNALFSTIQYSMILQRLSEPHKAVIRNWLGFSQKHRETLLKGAFRPHHPENGYTWIEAEGDAELIVAAYSDDICAKVTAADKPVYLVNATGKGAMLVDFVAAPSAIELFDVFGRPCGTARATAGLNRIKVPASGFARASFEAAGRVLGEPIQYWTPAGTNSWVGDVTAIRFKDRFHVFYLYDEHHHQAFGGKGGHIFKHLSSPDLKAWEEHPIAVGRDEPWEWIGTGTPLVKDGKLCLFYGLHSSRNGEGWKKKYPKGGTYAVSEDGIHFTKSHDIFTDDENPSPFWMDDGRIGIIHSGFSADKGWFAADRLAGPWSLVDDKMPTEGDCPCPFSWNGWHYVIQGFVTMAGSPTGKPGSYEDWVLAGDDVYGGLSVPMVADWKDGRRILVGWINGIDRYHEVPKGWNLQVWGGWLCFRELVQFPDGRLGTKWLEETPNRGETRTYACSPDKPFVLDFRTVRGERLEFRIDPQEARAQFSSDGTRKRTLAEVSRGLDMSKGKRIGQIAAGHLNAPYTAQDYAIGKIRGLDRPFTVRFSVHYDPKADGTIFDAEIAGTRTMVARAAGRFEPVRKD